MKLRQHKHRALDRLRRNNAFQWAVVRAANKIRKAYERMSMAMEEAYRKARESRA